MFLICCFVIQAQNKYTGTDNDCDVSLMPSTDIYKIETDTAATENKINKNITLPCDIYYQIPLKQKENETVKWYVSNYIITIYPKTQKKQENLNNSN